jgi:hypothetical protein
VYVFACASCKIKLYRWTPAPRACPSCGTRLRETALPRTRRLPLSAQPAGKPAEGARPPATA